MINDNGILYTLIYYRAHVYSSIALVLIIGNSLLTKLLLMILGVHDISQFAYNMARHYVLFISLGLLLLLFFFHARAKYYYVLTGRDIGYDMRHYRRTFFELVDYFENAEPHKLDTSSFPESGWQVTDGLIFGKDGYRIISIPSSSEANIAVFGPPGSGKTSGIAIINAMRFQGSVLAIDIKGDIYNYVHKHSDRKIIRFAPDAPNALEISCHFDPLADFYNMSETDQKLYLENMATVIIADEGGNEGNYFTTRARKLFQGITQLILWEDPHASFPDIIHKILTGNIFDWVTNALESDCYAAKEMLASLYKNNEKNVSGAYDALTTALVHFSNPILDELLTSGTNNISIQDLEDGSDIYLQISQEHLDAYAPLFTLLIQSFSTAFTKRADSSTGAKNRPILMLMDEFPQLTFSYKMINSNLSTLRSKSVICMVIQQNLSQLEYRYQPTGARSIIGNCNYQIILGSNDIESSETFSKLFGMKKVLKMGNTLTQAERPSAGYSAQETEVRVFPPEYFGDLSFKSKMILYYKGKYAELTKLNCYQ